MSKRAKKVTAGVLVLVMAVAAYLALSRLAKLRENTPEITNDVKLFEISSESISKIRYTFGGETISLSKNGDSWIYDNDPDFPLKESLVYEMTDAAASLSAASELTDAEEDKSAYGLITPTADISLFDDSNKEYSLKIGSYNSFGDGGYYCEYNNKIYVIPNELPDAFFRKSTDLLPKTTVPGITTDNIVSIEINGNKYDDDKCSDLCEKFTAMISTEVADYKNKELYGFDGSETKIVVTYTKTTYPSDGSVSDAVETEVTYTFLLSKDIDGQRYAMHENDDLIYYCNYTDDFVSAIS